MVFPVKIIRYSILGMTWKKIVKYSSLAALGLLLQVCSACSGGAKKEKQLAKEIIVATNATQNRSTMRKWQIDWLRNWSGSRYFKDSDSMMSSLKTSGQESLQDLIPTVTIWLLASSATQERAEKYLYAAPAAKT